MVITRSGLTLEDFLLLPEEKPALEFVDGRVTRKVSPNVDHSFLQVKLAAWVMTHAEPRQLGYTLTELRTTYAGASRVPDVAFYLRGRLPRTETGRLVRDATIPPDIAIEIRSPEQMLRSQLRRCHAYVADGVALAILVDPVGERVWTVDASNGERELAANESIDFGEILPDFRLTPAEIFASLTEA